MSVELALPTRRASRPSCLNSVAAPRRRRGDSVRGATMNAMVSCRVRAFEENELSEATRTATWWRHPFSRSTSSGDLTEASSRRWNEESCTHFACLHLTMSQRPLEEATTSGIYAHHTL